LRFGDSPIPLSLEHFRLLRDLINNRFGIYFTDDDLYLLENRLSERLRRLSLSSFEEYYHYIKYHPAGEQEIEQSAEILTTNETYFFREDYQLRTFAREILPQFHDKLRDKKRLMLWSAGCSSGEEVYTLAMIVHDSALFGGWDVRIFGSDISARMLSKARRGIFGTSAFRATSSKTIKKHFVKTSEGFKINDNIRSMCNFGRINLLDEDKIAFVGWMDAIFCRNVLIYFDKKSRRRGISILYDRLNPGGYLLLGHSESLLNVSTAFELVNLSEDLVYRRPKITDDY